MGKSVYIKGKNTFMIENQSKHEIHINISQPRVQMLPSYYLPSRSLVIDIKIDMNALLKLFEKLKEKN